MKSGWMGGAAGALMWGASAVVCAGVAGFLGKVAVEWDDSQLFNRHRVVLLADFGFQDAAGRQWVVRKGAVLDGDSFPPLYERLVGLPFVGEHRRAGILHDYFAQQLTHDWKQVRRMYYEALLAEGLSVAEAKTTYAVLYGVGLRWEVKGSSCYVNCHSAASSLAWKPDVTESEMEPVLALVGEGNPTLDEIDRAVDAAVPKPGPHLFSQLRPQENGALQRRRGEKETSPADAQGEPSQGEDSQIDDSQVEDPQADETPAAGAEQDHDAESGAEEIGDEESGEVETDTKGNGAEATDQDTGASGPNRTHAPDAEDSAVEGAGAKTPDTTQRTEPEPRPGEPKPDDIETE